MFTLCSASNQNSSILSLDTISRDLFLQLLKKFNNAVKLIAQWMFAIFSWVIIVELLRFTNEMDAFSCMSPLWGACRQNYICAVIPTTLSFVVNCDGLFDFPIFFVIFCLRKLMSDSSYLAIQVDFWSWLKWMKNDITEFRHIFMSPKCISLIYARTHCMSSITLNWTVVRYSHLEIFGFNFDRICELCTLCTIIGLFLC